MFLPTSTKYLKKLWKCRLKAFRSCSSCCCSTRVFTCQKLALPGYCCLVTAASDDDATVGDAILVGWGVQAAATYVTIVLWVMLSCSCLPIHSSLHPLSSQLCCSCTIFSIAYFANGMLSGILSEYLTFWYVGDDIGSYSS